jgi:methylenetetrahydrofolate reductase (NADPH)
MARLKDVLQAGKFVLTEEITAPKGVDISGEMQKLDLFLKGKILAINVTDNPSAVMRMSPIALCAKLVEAGYDTILHITCRDRNRLALQSEILGAYLLGIRNVLAITGDPPTAGDHPDAKPVFDLDAISLLQTLEKLRSGKDLAGNDLKGAPVDLFAGATVAPCADPLEVQISKMEKKIEAGARFFQTQAIYEPEKFERFMNQAQKFKMPVIAGIVIVKSPQMARHMNEHFGGVNIPESMIKPLEAASKDDRPKVAIEMMAKLMRQLRPFANGFHIMPIGWERYVPELLKQAGLV